MSEENSKSGIIGALLSVAAAFGALYLLGPWLDANRIAFFGEDDEILHPLVLFGSAALIILVVVKPAVQKILDAIPDVEPVETESSSSKLAVAFTDFLIKLFIMAFFAVVAFDLREEPFMEVFVPDPFDAICLLLGLLMLAFYIWPAARTLRQELQAPRTDDDQSQ